MSCVWSRLQLFLYRLSTIGKSFTKLYRLPQEKVDAFLGAYEIYNHDWENEEQLIREMGVNYYQNVKKKLIDYYSVLNHLCAIGQVEKMYIPPAMDLSVGIMANQNLFERRMAIDLGLNEKSCALDIGCGRGRIANHIASFSKARVIGMNIDPCQLESAKRLAKGRGMVEQCQFQFGDLNEVPLPFENHFFDAIYQVQVFSYAKNLKQLFQELYRILKPKGKIAFLDWVRLDQYDPNNPHHVSLMRKIKPLIGAIGTPSPRDFTDALRAAGFQIVTEKNLSIDGLQAPLIENADRFFSRMAAFIQFLVRWKILPAHFQAVFDRLTQDGEAFIEADRLRLVTTSYYVVAQK